MPKKMLLIGSSAKGALEYSYKNAAEQLGFETRLFDPALEEKKFVKGGRFGETVQLFLPIEQWIRKMNRELILLTRSYEPAVILLFTNVRVLPGTLACIRTIFPALKIVWIWPDSPLSLEKFNILNGPLLDLTASYSKATIPVFERMGFRNPHWVALAGDPIMHGREPQDKSNFRCDISFVGAWRPERERVMGAICEQFKDKRIEIHGGYWKRDCKNQLVRERIKSRGLYEKDMADQFLDSYININVIDDTNYPAANMRFFEIPTAGGLQVTSSSPEMEEIFRQHEQTIYFKDENEAIREVKWAFDNPEACAAIRRNAHQLIISDHTYRNRLNYILEQL